MFLVPASCARNSAVGVNSWILDNLTFDVHFCHWLTVDASTHAARVPARWHAVGPQQAFAGWDSSHWGNGMGCHGSLRGAQEGGAWGARSSELGDAAPPQAHWFLTQASTPFAPQVRRGRPLSSGSRGHVQPRPQVRVTEGSHVGRGCHEVPREKTCSGVPELGE